jgi:hypothetical protein
MTAGTKHCDYCRSSISEGQRWVRQKVYNPRPDVQEIGYLHYHAEPFDGESESCWEKYELQREIARKAA